MIGGKLEVSEDANIDGMKAENIPESTAGSYTALKEDFNALLTALKDGGLMVADAWTGIDVKSAPNIPIETTAENSAKATITYADNVIDIAVDIDDLEDSDHGETWGVHKWIGFGVDTGFDTIKGIVFDDGTAQITLGDDDIAEATSVGLSAGEFILYVKAEKIAAQGGKFKLRKSGYQTQTITMQITAPADNG